jgi:hypothetical protein
MNQANYPPSAVGQAAAGQAAAGQAAAGQAAAGQAAVGQTAVGQTAIGQKPEFIASQWHWTKLYFCEKSHHKHQNIESMHIFCGRIFICGPARIED